MNFLFLAKIFLHSVEKDVIFITVNLVPLYNCNNVKSYERKISKRNIGEFVATLLI